MTIIWINGHYVRRHAWRLSITIILRIWTKKCSFCSNQSYKVYLGEFLSDSNNNTKVLRLGNIDMCKLFLATYPPLQGTFLSKDVTINNSEQSDLVFCFTCDTLICCPFYVKLRYLPIFTELWIHYFFMSL